ncbi:LPS export ABC transporter periplasmic protein LptC [Cochleicola gelatinilyticus]|uniref:LPS export ABC transporter periplasmic protein LptC n=1 Tax=Cochleicola gelatinilyticus TaxID=1763537 RepID=A0A167IM95_9FLAO|nr:LPS export ABC transporter periplasmic protein LptC [Cochleicola gelatinilyticus]OAB79817.1 LPS export ABC transporter periplasmic protein LptC [Cochleicola gelatinilyticus]
MQTHKHMYKGVMILISIITLFACDGSYKDKQRLSLADEAPLAEGTAINLKYTDSGKVVTNLLAPRLLDFSNYEFPYQEFPEGVEVRFWDKDNKKSTITSDYAIRFDGTDMVDLRKNVKLVTSDSLVLEAEQLYWDQKNQWVFTDQPYRIKFKDGSYNDGARFDSNEDFTNFLSRKNEGVQLVETKENNDEN